MRWLLFLFLLLAGPALAQSNLLLTHLQVAPDTRSVAFAATASTVFGV